MDVKNLLQANLEWVEQVDAPRFYRTEHKGEKLLLRLNNFPEEPLFTVIGESIFDIEERPKTWRFKDLD